MSRDSKKWDAKYSEIIYSYAILPFVADMPNWKPL